MESMGTMRDLEQIQERDDAGNASRLMSLALGGLALACVLFAVGVMVGRESGDPRPQRQADPLENLDRLDRATRSENAASMTWPERLTGPAAAAPGTTAATGTTTATAAPTAVPAGPPAPSLGDPNLRPVLLGPPPPAATAAGLGIRLRDGAIPGAAPSLDPAVTNTTPAQAGSEGAFSVQVSSFRNLTHAQNFAQQLRQRGHRAFVAAPATDRNNNIWHRVRIGPFASQREAGAFRLAFEQREHLPTIVVRREPAAAAAQRD
jgi:cell division septation protein DedD